MGGEEAASFGRGNSAFHEALEKAGINTSITNPRTPHMNGRHGGAVCTNLHRCSFKTMTSPTNRATNPPDQDKINYCRPVFGVCLDRSQQALPRPSTVADDSKPSIWNSYGQQYPRVDPQLRAIFQLPAPDAQKVRLHLDKDYDMVKDTNGVWSVTTTPQAVGFHYYWFIVDGVNVADPASDSFFGVGRQYSGIEIPSAGEDFYDIKDVPHGEIRGH